MQGLCQSAVAAELRACRSVWFKWRSRFSNCYLCTMEAQVLLLVAVGTEGNVDAVAQQLEQE